MLVFIIKN